MEKTENEYLLDENKKLKAIIDAQRITLSEQYQQIVKLQNELNGIYSAVDSDEKKELDRYIEFLKFKFTKASQEVR